MADTITRFYVALRKLTEEEKKWLWGVLTPEGSRDNIPDELHVTEDEAEKAGFVPNQGTWPEFGYHIERGMDKELSCFMYSGEDGGGNPYQAALVIRAFLKKFRPDRIVDFCVACYSSRMFDDAGAEDLIVTSEAVYRSTDLMSSVYKALSKTNLDFDYGELHITISRHGRSA